MSRARKHGRLMDTRQLPLPGTEGDFKAQLREGVRSYVTNAAKNAMGEQPAAISDTFWFTIEFNVRDAMEAAMLAAIRAAGDKDLKHLKVDDES